jgi:Tol biopolymer transport system component
LYEVPVLGGGARKLIIDVDSPVAISPDGKQFAFVRGYQQETVLVVVNVDGTAERKLATRKSPASFRVAGPAWSPDGKIIAVGSGNVVVAVLVADGKERALASNLRGDVGRVAWLADGSGLLLITSDEAPRWQIYHLAYPSGQVRRITNDPNDYAGVSVTTDGKALVTVSTKFSTRFWIITQGEWSRPHDISPGSSEQDGFYGFSWMPDGRILYASDPDRKSHLCVMNWDGSYAKEFPVAVPTGVGVSACPDGRHVLFASQGRIARVDSEGGNLKRLTTGEGHYDSAPRCSPDGKWVVYGSRRADDRTLWRIPIEGGTPVQLRDKPTRLYAISPDGKSIACTEEENTNQPTKLIVFPSQGGPPSKTFDSLPGLVLGGVDWAPDGRSITFSATQTGASNVWTQPLAGGPPKQLTDFERGRSRNLSLAWSRDGKHLALVRGTYASDVVLISDFRGSEK